VCPDCAGDNSRTQLELIPEGRMKEESLVLNGMVEVLENFRIVEENESSKEL
jgi:hypothetical protein